MEHQTRREPRVEGSPGLFVSERRAVVEPGRGRATAADGGVAGAVASGTQQLAEGVGQVSDEVRYRARRLAGDLADLPESFRALVREYPDRALVVSLAVGLFLGAVLRRTVFLRPEEVMRG